MSEGNEEKIIPKKKVCMIDKDFFESLPQYAKAGFLEYDEKVDEYFSSEAEEWKRLLELKDELVVVHSTLKMLELHQPNDKDKIDYLWELYSEY